jgi:8-oxo-dGTP pyrophosphatase MutT (NUDIX family)
LEIVLCGRTRQGTWNLPKGTPDPGETLEQTAEREVREETGLEVEIGRSLGDISYWFIEPLEGVTCHKTVHFYLMADRGGSTVFHDAEFDEVRWFSAQKALVAVTHANEADVVRRALDLLESQR